MKVKIDIGLQAVLGLIFFVFGLNGFVEFIPMPELSPQSREVMGALAETGFFFPVPQDRRDPRRFSPADTALCSSRAGVVGTGRRADTAVSSVPRPGRHAMAVVITALEAYLGFVVYRDSFKGVLAARRSEPALLGCEPNILGCEGQELAAALRNRLPVP